MPGPDSARSSALGQNGRTIGSTKDSRINAMLFAESCQVWAICQRGWCAVAVERDQQIRKARELLAPPLHARVECQCDISRALDRVEHGAAAARSFLVAGSTEGKTGLKRYCATLQKLRNVYNSLDPAIRRWFSLAETAYVAGNTTVIDREIARAESFLNRPSLPPRRDASRHKIAVAAAYDLLEWWGHKAAVTRGGKWAQLATILAGDRTVDLFDHLREFKRSPGLTLEKVRGTHSILYRTRGRQPRIK
jgi:hypothetical protein